MFDDIVMMDFLWSCFEHEFKVSKERIYEAQTCQIIKSLLEFVSVCFLEIGPDIINFMHLGCLGETRFSVSEGLLAFLTDVVAMCRSSDGDNDEVLTRVSLSSNLLNIDPDESGRTTASTVPKSVKVQRPYLRFHL